MPTRDEIVDEIRRTAASSGGRPLGRGRFREATGITDYAVAQYWATYGDAVRDAGLEPNVLLGALDHQAVLIQLIELVRTLGHVPTANELRRARASDPSFPTTGVFERLGSKDARVATALDLCHELGGYDDVASVLALYLEERRAMPVALQSGGTSQASVTYGFMYLARGHRGEYKIGRTNLVDRRVAELGVTSPVELKLVHEIKTDDPAGVEAYWHRRFEGKRMRGEWFRLTSQDVVAFRRWKRIA